MSQWWQRVSAVSAPLPRGASVVIAMVALGLVLAAWPVVRTLVTICHEAGHAVIALLVGRKLSGIRVHSNTSGLTVTRGRPRGPGMVATLLAGYPAAAVVGLGLAWLAGTGRSAAAVWLLVILLAVMLAGMRNFYGALVVLATGAVLAIISWFAPPLALTWLAYGLAWLMLMAAPRPVLEVARNRSPGTDAAGLRRITGVPGLLWVIIWLLATIAALVAAAMILLNPVG